MCDKSGRGQRDDRATEKVSNPNHGPARPKFIHTCEIMRAIRFSGRGRTEAPFSCLPAPNVLMNMWLMILGSDMTVAVRLLMVATVSNAGRR